MYDCLLFVVNTGNAIFNVSELFVSCSASHLSGFCFEGLLEIILAFVRTYFVTVCFRDVVYNGWCGSSVLDCCVTGGFG